MWKKDCQSILRVRVTRRQLQAHLTLRLLKRVGSPEIGNKKTRRLVLRNIDSHHIPNFAHITFVRRIYPLSLNAKSPQSAMVPSLVMPLSCIYTSTAGDTALSHHPPTFTSCYKHSLATQSAVASGLKSSAIMTEGTEWRRDGLRVGAEA